MDNNYFLKNRISIIILSLLSLISNAQSYSTFESGTLEGWTNSDESITNLSIQQIGAEGSALSLIKECDGSNSVAGEMAVFSGPDFSGNWYDEGEVLLYSMRNPNPFDLYVRTGFRDSNDNVIVLTEPSIIPAFSNSWQTILQQIDPQNYTVVQGTVNALDVLINVQKLFFIHNQELSIMGAFESGTFELDQIDAAVLSIEVHQNDIFVIYPNPASDIITIYSDLHQVESVIIRDAMGKIVLRIEQDFNNIDISYLSVGIYIIQVSSEYKSQIIKLVRS